MIKDNLGVIPCNATECDSGFSAEEQNGPTDPRWMSSLCLHSVSVSHDLQEEADLFFKYLDLVVYTFLKLKAQNLADNYNHANESENALSVAKSHCCFYSIAKQEDADC